MSVPLLSVILPVYNAEAYLHDCLESLQDQTFKDFEVLIFDDASTDRSLGIARSFHDSRFKVERSEKNQGYAVYLNRGIERAEGKYIARMDADDICHPERFQKQIDFLEKNPDIGICGTAFEVFGVGASKVFRKPIKNEEIRWILLLDNPFQHPTVMLRREVLIQNQLRYREDLMPTEDYELWGRLLKVTQGANLMEPLLRYRIHPGQETIARRERQIRIHCLTAENLVNEFWTKRDIQKGFLKPGRNLEKFSLSWIEWAVHFLMNDLKEEKGSLAGITGYWDLVDAYFEEYPCENLKKEERKKIGKWLVSDKIRWKIVLPFIFLRPSLISIIVKRLFIRLKGIRGI